MVRTVSRTGRVHLGEIARCNTIIYNCTDPFQRDEQGLFKVGSGLEVFQKVGRRGAAPFR